jgi:hypothetical protein
MGDKTGISWCDSILTITPRYGNMSVEVNHVTNRRGKSQVQGT